MFPFLEWMEKFQGFNVFFFHRTGLLLAHTFLNYLENETRLLLLSNIFTDEWNFLFSNYLTNFNVIMEKN